jgi:hypothetical protein
VRRLLLHLRRLPARPASVVRRSRSDGRVGKDEQQPSHRVYVGDRSRSDWSVGDDGLQNVESSRAVRRAGQVAAPSPSAHARKKKAKNSATGTVVTVTPGIAVTRPGQPRDRSRAPDRRWRRRRRGSPPRSGPWAGSGRVACRGAQQPDLPGAFEHREHEGVHDPDERDENCERQEGVDEPKELVNLRRLRLLVLRRRLDLETAAGGDGVLDGPFDP